MNYKKLIAVVISLACSCSCLSSYAKFKETFGLKFEAGTSFNSDIDLNKSLLDVDNDGASKHKIRSRGDGFYAGTGAFFPIIPTGEVILEVLYGFNSKAKIDLIEEVVEDAGTGPNVAKTNITRNFGLLNLYLVPIEFNIFNGTKLSPFVQAGAGLAHNFVHSTKVDDNTGRLGEIKTNGHFDLAWSLGAGIAMDKFGIGYRYLDYGRAETKKDFVVDFTNTSNSGLPVAVKNTDPLSFDSRAHILYLFVVI